MKNLRLSEEQLQGIKKRLASGGAVRTHLLDGVDIDAVHKNPKYRNEKTFADGRVFHSKRECARWYELWLLEDAKEIADLKHQVRFDLHVKGFLVCAYVADFTYMQKAVFVVEDSKGAKTKDYEIKRKLMKAIHGIEVLET